MYHTIWCNLPSPKRCRVSFVTCKHFKRHIIPSFKMLERCCLWSIYTSQWSGFWKESSSFSKAESHKITFSTRYKETFTLEWLQVCAEDWMYFVLNIFLKPQERIRFYIFFHILTSLKEDKGIRVCYDLFSREFPFAFYKYFCFDI